MLSALPPTVILKKTSFKRDKTKRYDKISKRLRLEMKNDKQLCFTEIHHCLEKLTSHLEKQNKFWQHRSLKIKPIFRIRQLVLIEINVFASFVNFHCFQRPWSKFGIVVIGSPWSQPIGS